MLAEDGAAPPAFTPPPSRPLRSLKLVLLKALSGKAAGGPHRGASQQAQVKGRRREGTRGVNGNRKGRGSRRGGDLCSYRLDLTAGGRWRVRAARANAQTGLASAAFLFPLRRRSGRRSSAACKSPAFSLRRSCRIQTDERRSRHRSPLDTRVFFPPARSCLNPVGADKRRPGLAATLRRGQQEGQEVSRRHMNAIAAEQIRAGGLRCLVLELIDWLEVERLHGRLM